MNALSKWPLDDTTRRRAMQSSTPNTGLRAKISRFADPRILFPLLSVLVLSVVWSATYKLIKVERANGEAVAAGTARELLNTYQAQVVRAVREIDRTLKMIQYVHENKGADATLAELESRDLLLPKLLFVITVVNSDGDVVASSPQASSPPGAVPQELSA